jgi:rhomboid protease GluP
MPEEFPQGPSRVPDGYQRTVHPDYADHVRQAHEQQAELRRRLVEFWGRLYLHTPRVFVTKVLVGLNVAVFVVMMLAGVSATSPSGKALLRWGANYGPLTLDGQWWRLITCMFLHFGVLHLGFNMYALWSVGPMVERLLGNSGFLIMYLVAGVLASTVSVLWHPVAYGAGASGAVFGVVGALLGYLVRQRDSVPVVVLAQFKQSLIPFLIYNLLFGLVPGIDMSAHVGGFCAGFLCGLVQSQPLGAPRIGRLPRNLLVALAGPALAALLITRFGGKVADPDEEVSQALESEHKAVAVFAAAAQQMNQHQIRPQQFASILEAQAIPELAKARERLLGLKGLSTEGQQYVAKLIEYMQTREQGWRLLAEGYREGDRMKQSRGEEQLEAAMRMLDELNKDPAKR